MKTLVLFALVLVVTLVSVAPAYADGPVTIRVSTPGCGNRNYVCLHQVETAYGKVVLSKSGAGNVGEIQVDPGTSALRVCHLDIRVGGSTATAFCENTPLLESKGVYNLPHRH